MLEQEIIICHYLWTGAMYIEQKKRVSIIMQAPSEGATTEQLA